MAQTNPDRYTQTCNLNETQMVLLLINPFPNKPWFLRVCSVSLLKTLWGKEKFLLFPQFFLPVSRTFCHFHQT